MTRSGLATLAGLGLLFTGAARGDDDSTHRFPSRAVHMHERAGYPQEVSKFAAPAPGRFEAGGWVGGGRLALFHRPDGKAATEGTWGTDYVGLGRRPGRVFLDWWHDRPKQPMPGPYSADGPHVPDPIGAHPVQRLIGGK